MPTDKIIAESSRTYLFTCVTIHDAISMVTLTKHMISFDYFQMFSLVFI
jgi:hypothetical protein